MTIWGIDPGKEGALAIIDDNHKVEVIRFMKYTEADLSNIFFDRSLDVDQCYYEKVGAMPKDGVRQAFTFGDGYGFIRGLLTAYKVPFDFVAPQVWQRKLSLGKARGSKTERKRAHKEKAQQLFAGLTITNDMADAILIAEYGYRIFT